jgi:hypothetical protein
MSTYEVDYPARGNKIFFCIDLKKNVKNSHNKSHLLYVYECVAKIVYYSTEDGNKKLTTTFFKIIMISFQG